MDVMSRTLLRWVVNETHHKALDQAKLICIKLISENKVLHTCKLQHSCHSFKEKVKIKLHMYLFAELHKYMHMKSTCFWMNSYGETFKNVFRYYRNNKFSKFTNSYK